jgi:hypothetical protein
VWKPSDQDQSNALIICACLLILYMLIRLWKSFMIGLVGREIHNGFIVSVILICTVQEAHSAATTYPLLFGSPSTDTVEFLFNWKWSAGSHLLTTYCLGLLEQRSPTKRSPRSPTKISESQLSLSVSLRCSGEQILSVENTFYLQRTHSRLRGSLGAWGSS